MWRPPHRAPDELPGLAVAVALLVRHTKDQPYRRLIARLRSGGPWIAAAVYQAHPHYPDQLDGSRDRVFGATNLTAALLPDAAWPAWEDAPYLPLGVLTDMGIWNDRAPMPAPGYAWLCSWWSDLLERRGLSSLRDVTRPLLVALLAERPLARFLLADLDEDDECDDLDDEEPEPEPDDAEGEA